MRHGIWLVNQAMMSTGSTERLSAKFNFDMESWLQPATYNAVNNAVWGRRELESGLLVNEGAVWCFYGT
jgi:hypothetical protein